MEQIKQVLQLEENRFGLKTFFVLMVVAYLFSIAVRFIWFNHTAGIEAQLWNDQVMINTNDGYQWAEGARDILENRATADQFPANTPIAKLTAFFASVLPFTLETVILFMPAFLGSLLVVPVMLIGRALNQDTLGFVGALIAGITWSYYNRTMIGYYDTDMLTIVMPALVLWSVILGVTHNKNRFLLIVAFSIIISRWWYGGSYSLILATAAVLFFYALLFDRKNLYNFKLLAFILIAIMMIPITIKIAILLVVFAVFHYMKEKADKLVLPLLGIAVVGMLLSGGFGPILTQLDRYLFRPLVADEATVALHFFNVVQTVREAGQIPFEMFANRISGHPLTFVLSTLGYILLALRYPVMWLALPMLGLGFFALKGGLRFTVYTVPINALGIAFLIVWGSKWIKNSTLLRYGVIFFATVAVLYPNIRHVIDYKVPTVFNREEVTVLDELNSIASESDYTLGWWDYGYPIRYYSDTRTLIDGGAHDGHQNFPVSYALTFPQNESATMARLNVEYYIASRQNPRKGSLLKHMMEDYGYTEPNHFLQYLQSGEIRLPEKTREVYYYLPLRMLNIYQTVRLFSNLDLVTGSQFAQPFLYTANSFKDMGDKVMLGNGIEVDKRRNSIKIGQQELPINSLFVTVYDGSGKLRVHQQNFNLMAPVSVVYMKSYNKFLVMDQQTLNSTYMQLFVLENYDRNLFEPVILTPLAKVYRLKI